MKLITLIGMKRNELRNVYKLYRNSNATYKKLNSQNVPERLHVNFSHAYQRQYTAMASMIELDRNKIC